MDEEQGSAQFTQTLAEDDDFTVVEATGQFRTVQMFPSHPTFTELPIA
jgi:hypothetical protein